MARQWPAEGRWALVFTVTGGHGVSTLLTLKPGAVVRIATQKSTYEKPSATEIETFLASAVASR